MQDTHYLPQEAFLILPAAICTPGLPSTVAYRDSFLSLPGGKPWGAPGGSGLCLDFL